MAISEANRGFITGLIDYYVSTAPSYRELARAYQEFAGSVDDVALGMIAGSVYSSFMQMCKDQQITPSLEDMGEFDGIMIERVADIKRAIAAAGGRGQGGGGGARPAGGPAGGVQDGGGSRQHKEVQL